MWTSSFVARALCCQLHGNRSRSAPFLGRCSTRRLCRFAHCKYSQPRTSLQLARVCLARAALSFVVECVRNHTFTFTQPLPNPHWGGLKGRHAHDELECDDDFSGKNENTNSCAKALFKMGSSTGTSNYHKRAVVHFVSQEKYKPDLTTGPSPSSSFDLTPRLPPKDCGCGCRPTLADKSRFPEMGVAQRQRAPHTPRRAVSPSSDGAPAARSPWGSAAIGGCGKYIVPRGAAAAEKHHAPFPREAVGPRPAERRWPLERVRPRRQHVSRRRR